MLLRQLCFYLNNPTASRCAESESRSRTVPVRTRCKASQGIANATDFGNEPGTLAGKNGMKGWASGSSFGRSARSVRTVRQQHMERIEFRKARDSEDQKGSRNETASFTHVTLTSRILSDS